jgi:hypothetical protein
MHLFVSLERITKCTAYEPKSLHLVSAVTVKESRSVPVGATVCNFVSLIIIAGLYYLSDR